MYPDDHVETSGVNVMVPLVAMPSEPTGVLVSPQAPGSVGVPITAVMQGTVLVHGVADSTKLGTPGTPLLLRAVVQAAIADRMAARRPAGTLGST